MALDAKHRSSIYGKLIPLLGEEDANVMMSEFPSVEADELVTRQFLRAELAEFRADLERQIGELRADVERQIGELRADFGLQHGELRAEFSDRLHRHTIVTVGLVVTATAMIEALATLV